MQRATLGGATEFPCVAKRIGATGAQPPVYHLEGRGETHVNDARVRARGTRSNLVEIGSVGDRHRHHDVRPKDASGTDAEDRESSPHLEILKIARSPTRDSSEALQRDPRQLGIDDDASRNALTKRARNRRLADAECAVEKQYHESGSPGERRCPH